MLFKGKRFCGRLANPCGAASKVGAGGGRERGREEGGRAGGKGIWGHTEAHEGNLPGKSCKKFQGSHHYL